MAGENRCFLFFKDTFKLQSVSVCCVLALNQICIVYNTPLKDETTHLPARGPQDAGWCACWWCLLLCPPFASCSLHSWGDLGNDLRAYFALLQSGRFQRSHMRWLWWHHWWIKAMPSRVQSQKWQRPSQEHFLLRLKATNHVLFQDIPVEHILNAKIRELSNKHGYCWFIALLLTFTLFVYSVKVSLDPLTIFQLREQVHQ